MVFPQKVYAITFIFLFAFFQSLCYNSRYIKNTGGFYMLYNVRAILCITQDLAFYKGIPDFHQPYF